jgi:site-specific recombinase XerD
MKGARKLSDDEIANIASSFSGRHAVRDRTLFILGLSTGGRISELLSLRIKDVWQYSKPVDTIYFRKSKTKGQRHGRGVPIKTAAQNAITELIQWYQGQGIKLSEETPLFLSQKGGEITRQHAHDILNKAFTIAKLQGKVSAHSLRKTYANKLLQQGGNLYAVKEALGHASVQTTQDYLGIDEDQLRAATPDFLFFDSKSDSIQLLSDLSDKDQKIASLEAIIKALENQLQYEISQTGKVIQFPELVKRKKSS